MTRAPSREPLSDRATTRSPAVHGVSVRFVATLLANVVRAVASFAGGAIVARALGAADYGNLNFLLASFAAFLPLLDAGTSSAFFTFLSRRKRGLSFFLVFGAWLLIQALVPLVAIAALLPNRVVSEVWLGQPRGAIVLAFASVFLNTQLWGAVSRMGEARRLTVRVQIAGTLQAIAHLALVTAGAVMGWLTVYRVFVLLIVEFSALCLAMTPRLFHDNVDNEADRGDIRSVVRDVWKYCRPLLLYSWIGVPYAFADRWMLQKFAGSAQQGYFSLGAQFATISLLATTSILSVFWKEVVDAAAAGDRARVRMLHTRVTRSLYFAAAWLSCGLIPYSAEILTWTAGAAYGSAGTAMALLLVYPVHQSLGQIQGTFLFASEDTKTYAIVGIIVMIVSIPAAYILLAPRAAAVPGFSLGAVGLALKMVVLQVISVNIQGWFIARKNGWELDLAHQALTLSGLFGFAWLTRLAVATLLQRTFGPAPMIFVMAIALLLYAVISGAMVLRWPSLIGASREDLTRWRAVAGGRLRRRIV